MAHLDFVDSHPNGGKLLAEIDTQRVEERLRARAEEIASRRAHLRGDGENMRDGELADYDQHPADQGSETFEQERDETADMILEEEARRVKEAQQRLADGQYGVCVVCGGEIPPARLDAIPETIRCIDHQREYDARG
jgi:RNA polymerase-binding transcription factor DksA